MAIIKDTEAAYIAGFFDGEGWIGINKRTSGGYSHFALMVGAGQCDPRPLLFIQERFGGRISVGRKPGTHIFHTWVVYSRVAESFLRCVEKYLIHKREQCEVAISYRGFVNKRSKGNHLSLDEEYAELLKRARGETRVTS